MIFRLSNKFIHLTFVNTSEILCAHLSSGRIYEISFNVFQLIQKISFSKTVRYENLNENEKKILLALENIGIAVKTKGNSSLGNEKYSYFDFIKNIPFKDFDEIDRKKNIAYYKSLSVKTTSKHNTFKKYKNVSFRKSSIKNALDTKKILDIIQTTFSQVGYTDWTLPNLGPGLRRTSPSNGGRHPIEAYFYFKNIQSIENCFYHYNSGGNYFSQIFYENSLFEDELRDFQNFLSEAYSICVLTSSFKRSQLRYRDQKSFISIFLDAGHLIGTMDMLFTSCGFEIMNISISPEIIHKVLSLDPSEEGVIKVILIRHKKQILDRTTHNLVHRSLQPAEEKIIKLPQGFEEWNKCGWGVAAWAYITHIKNLQYLREDRVLTQRAIFPVNYVETLNLLKRRTTQRSFHKNNIALERIQKLVEEISSSCTSIPCKILIGTKKNLRKGNNFQTVHLSDKRIGFYKGNLSKVLKEEFEGQINTKNAIISIHFLLKESDYQEVGQYSYFNILTEIGSLAQKFLIISMKIGLGAVTTHATRNINPLFMRKYQGYRCLYNIVLGQYNTEPCDEPPSQN